MHLIVRTMLVAAALAPSAPGVGLAHDARVLQRVLQGSQPAPRDTVPDIRKPDTTTDTTTAVWRHCVAAWDQVQRRLYKRWADAGDLPHWNQHIYPCVRNASVYLVTAKDFTRMFAPYVPTSRSDTAKPKPYDLPASNAWHRFVQRGSPLAGNADQQDTLTSYFINLTDSPYKGAKEFEQLLEGFREHLQLRQSGAPPLIVLNGVLVKDLRTPIDINHIRTITVMAGPVETYPSEVKPFYDPGGSILIEYWDYP